MTARITPPGVVRSMAIVLLALAVCSSSKGASKPDAEGAVVVENDAGSGAPVPDVARPADTAPAADASPAAPADSAPPPADGPAADAAATTAGPGAMVYMRRGLDAGLRLRRGPALAAGIVFVVGFALFVTGLRLA
jgi:hypothetical protein